MNLKEKLNLLEGELTRIESPILRLLRDSNDGFDRDKTAHVLTNLGMCPLQMVLDFYDWATGADENILFNINNQVKLSTIGNPAKVSITTSLYMLDVTTDNFFAHRKMLPFIYNGIMEDPILIDLSPKSKTIGALYYYSPQVTLSVEPIMIYDSLELWIDTMLLCYSNGIYSIKPNGMLVADVDKEIKITRKLNPHSIYWD